MFSSNPKKVPSIKDEKGVRQPLCRICAERVILIQREAIAEGRLRLDASQKPMTIHPDAYAVSREEEL